MKYKLCLSASLDSLLGSGSGSYSGGLTWSIVLRCDDHTGIFTCDGCARDPYFYVPAETQSYVIKLSCSRKALAASGIELGTFGLQRVSHVSHCASKTHIFLLRKANFD